MLVVGWANSTQLEDFLSSNYLCGAESFSLFHHSMLIGFYCFPVLIYASYEGQSISNQHTLLSIEMK